MHRDAATSVDDTLRGLKLEDEAEEETKAE
jgi:hypothetical protein